MELLRTLVEALLVLVCLGMLSRALTLLERFVTAVEGTREAAERGANALEEYARAQWEMMKDLEEDEDGGGGTLPPYERN